MQHNHRCAGCFEWFICSDPDCDSDCLRMCPDCEKLTEEMYSKKKGGKDVGSDHQRKPHSGR